MQVEEALAKLRAAPSYAPVSQLGIPSPVLEEMSSLPEYDQLVIDGCRKRLTRPEVDERLPLYLDRLKKCFRSSLAPGGVRINRQQVAESVGLSYSAVRNRTQQGHDDYIPAFAKAERSIYDEAVCAIEDLHLWLVGQPAEGEEGWGAMTGYSLKQLNAQSQILRLRHADYKDTKQVHVSGQIGHMHIHGMLCDELAETSGRFEKPVAIKELTA